MRFEEFLQHRLESGGFTTEDALASFLPLAQQVLETHAAGHVAPLEGLQALGVAGVQVWFEQSQRATPRNNRARLRQLEAQRPGLVDIREERRVTAEIGEGTESVEDLHIGRREDEMMRPVYLPGYVAWEHLAGHHDPLTDLFSLGLILASLSCGLNLADPEQLRLFVAHRRNLFRLNADLHPVIGQIISRLTELNRHERPQDLATVLRALQNYRDQDVDFAVQLAQTPEFARQEIGGKRQVVLSKLQQRLFEISRRNRLLHFRPTLQSVNLTQASVPLTFDIRSIRTDQILTWNEKFHRDVASGASISLNGYLNFREAVYLPGVLDRIRTEAERDRNEYGFAQLRLVACFLHWTNLKQSPPEPCESPLVLLPVELTKKKGVRDTYWLKPLDSVAEVNPVVRHLFDELYDIELPETVDLEQSGLDDLHQMLAAQIAVSEPAVRLEKVDRPRIDLIHAQARRRLDQYCRNVRLSGRGIRNFMDLDYSYDPANYHPLGLKLFMAKVRPAETKLKQIVDAKPATRRYAVPADGNSGEPAVAIREQSFFALRGRGDDNPYTWEFDLCSVTLGNFRYRKMSLVQDYSSLLAENAPHPAFDAAFSLAPRQQQAEAPKPQPLSERFDVVPCDPTQAMAIAESRTDRNYIIQGPPGTGKSQTITNLIADFVARGKRVLFVCEKRAAIDVVYHRLRQKGLDSLCCLIHDSKADKKQFVQDLKATYEAFLAKSGTKRGRAQRRRRKVLEALETDLGPLVRFDEAMVGRPSAGGVPVRRLLQRAIELHDVLPELRPEQFERVPHYAVWCGRHDALGRLRQSLCEVSADGILAHHPLRLLRTSLKNQVRPLEFVSACIPPARELLERFSQALRKSLNPSAPADTLDKIQSLVEYALATEFLARRDLLALLDTDSARAHEFRKRLERLRKPAANLRARQKAAAAWNQKLSAAETDIALSQAQSFERDSFRLLKPGWWRLRAILNRCYNFGVHQIKPAWSQVLRWLKDEYEAADACAEAEAEICRQYGLDEPLGEFRNRVEQLMQAVDAWPQQVRDAHFDLTRAASGNRQVVELAAAAGDLQRLRGQLDRFLEGYATLSLEELGKALGDIEAARGTLPEYLDCLRALSEMPQELADALRNVPCTLAQLEAASAARSIGEVVRGDKSLTEFDGRTHRRHVQALSRLSQQWQEANALAVCERVRERFLDHVRISAVSATQLSADEKEFKKQYSRGRRELEHEFGKTLRFRPIRDMVCGTSGMVVQDLKPVWLMSPLSVSDTLPLDTRHFDVVIFDEASQIPLEEAVPSLFRASQTIVVGDEMQLPPTNFFSARRDEDDDLVAFEENGEQFEFDLASNSLLNHAARNLPARMLGWHYRSRSESLISFSNWAFYGGRLLTVPEERLVETRRPELVATCAADAGAHLAEALERPVSFHFLQHGVYEKRRNRPEAEYIAELVRGLICREARPSVGIVAFSEAQQAEIEAALDRLARDDQKFRDRLEEELEREEDGHFAGLLVKNLENIQGDERDVIILSVCYAHGPEGRMRMNFGPINQSGGEKRLNVAFSRAKQHMALVSSIRSAAITNDYNDGANCLKNYLQYAEACSVGDTAAAGRILSSLAPSHVRNDEPADADDAVMTQLASALRERGYRVDLGVGQSHFRCDLAVRRDGDTAYRLGILVDSDAYYAQRDILERDLMKPRLLEQFGWRVVRVFAKNWWEAPERVLEDVLRLLTDADETEPFAVSEDRHECSGESEQDVDVFEATENRVLDDADNRHAPHEAGVARPEMELPEDSAGGKHGAAHLDDCAAPPAGTVPVLERQLEFVQGASAEFWEISVTGAIQTVRFGRLGSTGQAQSKTFPAPEIAERDALRQIEKKLAKGYVERRM